MMINLYRNSKYMRRFRFFACILSVLTVHILSAQDKIVYKDATEFPFYGRIHQESDNPWGDRTGSHLRLCRFPRAV